MPIRIAKTVEALPPSGIRAFFDLVLGMKDVVSLGVGEPDFMTPWTIREAAVRSLEQGETSYTSNKGMPELRREIAAFLKRRYGLRYDPEEEILVTVGVSEAVDLALRALIDPGDGVVVPEPAYVSYGPTARLAGAEVTTTAVRPEDGFRLTPEQLRAVPGGSKVLVLNYPSNPTGASYTRRQLGALARAVKQRDLLVISDEVYDELTYDFEHTPLAALPGMRDRVVYLNGFSKTYAMTGFRLGWACGPAPVIAAMTKIHQYTMLCAPITGQIAGREALRRGGRAVRMMKDEYDRRRRYIVEALNALGLECHMPQGAFYVFPSIRRTGMDSLSFAEGLLTRKRVALVPGTAFGASGEGYVRISYASAFEHLETAVTRIAEYLREAT